MLKSKYNPDEWCRGAQQISAFLGITRMTLYRWSKLVPLEHTGGTNNYNKERYGNHAKVSLVDWALKAYKAVGRNNYYIRKRLDELHTIRMRQLIKQALH